MYYDSSIRQCSELNRFQSKKFSKKLSNWKFVFHSRQRTQRKVQQFQFLLPDESLSWSSFHDENSSKILEEFLYTQRLLSEDRVRVFVSMRMKTLLRKFDEKQILTQSKHKKIKKIFSLPFDDNTFSESFVARRSVSNRKQLHLFINALLSVGNLSVSKWNKLVFVEFDVSLKEQSCATVFYPLRRRLILIINNKTRKFIHSKLLT